MYITTERPVIREPSLSHRFQNHRMMALKFTHLILMIVCFHMINCGDVRQSVQIQGSGSLPVDVQDASLRMYLNVENLSKKSTSVSVRSHKCCLIFCKGEEDCKIMELFGGFTGQLKSMEKKRISFDYPTLYPYDLEGECEIHIHTKGEKHQSHSIPFKTHIKKETNKLTSWMPLALQEFLFGKVTWECKGRDQDSLKKCEPVNCIYKYRGQRNFYNKLLGQCERVPTCKDKIQIYDPVNNKCKKNSPGIESVSFPKLDMEVQNWRLTIQILCVHGMLREDKKSCNCNFGWKSANLSSDHLNPDHPVYYMCDIPTTLKETGPSNLQIILLFAVCLFGVLIVVLIILFIRSRLLDRPPPYTGPDGTNYILCAAEDTMKTAEMDVGNVKTALLSPMNTSIAPVYTNQ